MSFNGFDMLTLSPEQAELLALLLDEQSLSSEQTTAIAPRPLKYTSDRGDALSTADYPLSFAQGRLWFLHQMVPTSPLYNIPLALRCEGVLNIPVLERVLSEIIRRHEVLRATFHNVGGEPVQEITPPQPHQLPVVDLATVPAAEREIALQEQIRTAAGEPFDLENGPLLRTQLLRLTATDHVLLIVLHHIVTDGVSYGVLMQELATLYTAFVNGQPSPLPGLRIQFADFAHWQRAWLQGDVLAEQLAFWRQALAGAPAILELPTDFPRPPVQSYWGDRRALTLSPALSEALRTLGRQQGVTLFSTLLAAFNVLLARYTRQQDVVVGAPVANRHHPGLEDLIGLFVNTLALRTDLSANPTVSELLAQVGATVVQAYDHQELPFEQLVEALQPVRNLSHSPLFQVLFNYLPTPVTTLSLPNLTVRTLEQPSGIAKFDLTLTVEEGTDTLTLALEYNTDLFTGESIERMLRHYQTLLTGMVANPQQRVLSLPLLTPAEAEQILVTWNATHADFGPDLCIHQRFEQQAAATPNAVAVADFGFSILDFGLNGAEQIENPKSKIQNSLTYSQLNARANQLAHHLRRLGVGREMMVGLCVERSVEMIVAMLAILKAGGAYVPLDPSYPQERLAFMLQDAGAPVLVTQAHLRAQLPATSAQVVCVDQEWPQIATQPNSNLVHEGDADTLAYVIYTSGSTGQPKGALNTHRGLSNLLHDLQATHRLSAADKTLQTTTFSFDVATAEIFWPLLTGASLVLTRPDGQRDGAYLVEMIGQHSITTLHMAPALLQMLVEEPGIDRCTTLKRVIAAGEALPLSLQQRFFARLPLHVELHNLYGPTETAVYVTAWQCQRDSTLNIVPIGRPLANTQAYVLDEQLQPVPIGVPGELHIGGVQVGRGYHKRPALTAEKFIDFRFWILDFGLGNKPLSVNQKSKIQNPKLYKTGDLVRWLPGPEGTPHIEYLGRLDHQVKVRGFRIELGEIETVLMQHPGVQTAVVLAVPAANGHKRLVAYVVPQLGAETETTVNSSALQAHLRARLPDYMTPTAFLLLEKLPLTPNGKVDRKALAALSTESLERSAAFVAPRNAMETALAQIWTTVLQVQAVGVEDNFFELGGHSLLITQIVARVEETFAVKMPLQAFFETPTVAHLALVIEQAQHAPQTETTTIQRVDRNEEEELLSTLDDLSDAEVEALLSTMLQAA